MAVPRLSRTRAALAATALAIVTAIGTGVAVANEPVRASGEIVWGAPVCGPKSSYTFSGITVAVLACMREGGSGGSPILQNLAQVTITAPSTASPLAYCKVSLEGTMHAASPREPREYSCYDFLNKTTTFYGDVDSRATLTPAWSLATVLFGVNKESAKVVTAKYEVL